MSYPKKHGSTSKISKPRSKNRLPTADLELLDRESEEDEEDEDRRLNAVGFGSSHEGEVVGVFTPKPKKKLNQTHLLPTLANMASRSF